MKKNFQQSFVICVHIDIYSIKKSPAQFLFGIKLKANIDELSTNRRTTTFHIVNTILLYIINKIPQTKLSKRIIPLYYFKIFFWITVQHETGIREGSLHISQSGSNRWKCLSVISFSTAVQLVEIILLSEYFISTQVVSMLNSQEIQFFVLRYIYQLEKLLCTQNHHLTVDK